MLRIIFADILGGVVYHAWVFMSWMTFGVHEGTMGALPNPNAVTTALKSQNLESGVYTRPWPSNNEEAMDPESAFSKRHAAGPLFTIYYRAEGAPSMSVNMIVRGLVLNIASAGLAACLLSCTAGCCCNYFGRVGFVLGLGLFAAIVTHGAYWNWMGFPAHYTLMFVVDLAVGWTLAGLVMAALVKPRPAAAATAV